jgi:hypothetical protein
MSSNGCKRWFLTAIALLVWSNIPPTEAQPGPPQGVPPIRLSAGALAATNGIDRALTAAAPVSLQGGGLHFIIQFEGRPSNRDRESLAALGIRLLDPVPVNAYFAVASPPRANSAVFAPGGPLDQPPYRAVVFFPPRYKLAPSLQAALGGQAVPPHADRDNGRIAVTIRFHSDVSAQERSTALRTLGVVVETPDPIRELQRGVEAVVPLADLLQVAEQDRIRSIDFIEHEGENDNDTVRGADGADSDAVITAYEVTGKLVVIGQFEGGVAGSHKDLSSSLVVADPGAMPDSHATHVAGTLIGSGKVNDQWRGVATGARILAYDEDDRQNEYLDAIDTHGLIASNTSWDSWYCHRISTAEECYDDHSLFYDQLISGRTEWGVPTGLARRILFVGSAGNHAEPERHADNVTANGQYDPGEAIYQDTDDDGTVSPGDLFKGIGTEPDDGAPLINFALNERHNDSYVLLGYRTGLYEPLVQATPDEIIYRDVDNSLDISVGDVRLSGPTAGSLVLAVDSDVNVQPGDVRLLTTTAGPEGSIVLAGDSDVSIPEQYLRQFRMWGNVRLQNSAKNTIMVGSYLAGSPHRTLDHDSARGPTPDGRLKPDLVAPGSQYGGEGGVTSTVPVDSYLIDHGTSMAAPVVTAVAAMLIEWYRDACENEDANPKPSTLRAILLHSAVDLQTIQSFPGLFVGPDYAYGYGAVNAPNALAVMAHHREGVVTESDLENPDAHTFEMTIGSDTDLKVTLAWDDPPWTAGTPRDPTTGLLHNDLDLELVAPDGTIYTPWRLDPSNPGEPAVASPGYAAGVPIPDDARDRRNTVEQIVFPNAPAGPWTIRVLASTLDYPDQDFSVVSDFLEPQEGAPCNAAAPTTDVWVQDDPAEDGETPSLAPWLSFDVWNDNRDAEIPSAALRNDPAFDEVNDLYVRLRNRSPQAAKASSIDVWTASASTAPSWPNDFAYVGRLAAPSVDARRSRVLGPLPWVPRQRSPSNQLSYYVRVTNPHDPIPEARTGAAQSNNIAVRNLHELDLRNGAQVIAFDLGNLTPRSGRQLETVDLVISVTPGRSLPIAARLELHPDVEQRWLTSGARGSGFRGPADASRGLMLTSSVARLRLNVDPMRPAEGLVRASISSTSEQSTPIQLDVVQCIDERVTGGIRYLLHTAAPRRPRASDLGPPAWLNGGNCGRIP